MSFGSLSPPHVGRSTLVRRWLEAIERLSPRSLRKTGEPGPKQRT